MSPQKKAVWVGMILVGGILLALPFRHTTPPADLSPESLAKNRIWLQKPVWNAESESDNAVITETGLPASTKLDSGNTEQRSMQPPMPSQSIRDDLEPQSPADDLEPIQRRPQNPWPATLGSELTDLPPDVVVVKKPADQISRSDSDGSQRPRTFQPESSPRRNQPTQSKRTLKHTVRDGDTLRSLAQRYLGDSRRAKEIYDANRARLPNAAALPIGEDLTIIVY